MVFFLFAKNTKFIKFYKSPLLNRTNHRSHFLSAVSWLISRHKSANILGTTCRYIFLPLSNILVEPLTRPSDKAPRFSEKNSKCECKKCILMTCCIRDVDMKKEFLLPAPSNLQPLYFVENFDIYFKNLPMLLFLY